MSKVLFSVSYSIPDGKRSEYLAAVASVRDFYASSDVQFSLYETKGKHNHFQEVYVYPNADAYEASDDPASTASIAGSIEKIYALASNVTYDVANEVA
ncbi:MAG TPA: hypothetical protein DCZ59_00630 [Bacteroidetes bacterium]|nr:hypothetical protein [Bacteroidota bacterium]